MDWRGWLLVYVGGALAIWPGGMIIPYIMRWKWARFGGLGLLGLFVLYIVGGCTVGLVRDIWAFSLDTKAVLRLLTLIGGLAIVVGVIAAGMKLWQYAPRSPDGNPSSGRSFERLDTSSRLQTGR